MCPVIHESRPASAIVDGAPGLAARVRAMTIPRDGVRERGILGILVFGAPRGYDLFGRLCVTCARMPFLFGVSPQKSIFCCADFVSALL